ncbi:MAG: SWIM zinc finger family protein, partial [Bacteroidaceae bacterium]|nr:SWIM zinc finger family protein [Bacteroidaceae bacterium]
MATKFGNTWWGNYWLRSLTHIDYANRIPRGASYARAGYVVDIKINNNVILAKVRGSRPSPYKEKITIPAFSQEETNRLISGIMEYPALISKLLNRELSPEILDIAKGCGLKVFPTAWSDFEMECSCPDWAVPCKHLAAVIYMLSLEIDNNPFLVFEMHGVDIILELKKRGITIDSKKNMAVKSLNDCFIALKKKNDGTDKDSDFFRLDFSKIDDLGDALTSLLADAPPFYPGRDFKTIFHDEVVYLSNKTKRLMNKKISFDEIAGIDNPVDSISQYSDITIEVNGDFDWTINHQRIDNPRKKYQKTFSIEEFISNLLALNPDYIENYQPSVAALHQILLFSIHLLSHGAVIPDIYETGEKKYIIRWMAAELDTEIKKLVGDCDRIVYPRLITASTGKKIKEIQLVDGAAWIISLFLNTLIKNMSHATLQYEKIDSMFFCGESHQFNDIGEKENAGGIKVWLDRYFIGTRKYCPVIMVDEDKDDGFLIDLEIEKQKDINRMQLRQILNEDVYTDERFPILSELSLLSTLITSLDQYINNKAVRPMHLHNKEFIPFLIQSIPALRMLNVKVMLPKSLQNMIKPKSSLAIKTKSNSKNEKSFIHFEDLLEFDWQVALGKDVISTDEFVKLLNNASGLIKFKENYFYINESEIESLLKAISSTAKPSKMQMLQAALTGEYNSAPIILSDEVKELIRLLTSNDEITVPEDLNATLRPYQQRGFSWMYRNMRIGFGSIIADDMGLGKTLQVITLLLKAKHENAESSKRFLIVVPTGLILNWVSEFNRFAPALTVFVYHGQNRDIGQFDADIMLTSYGILRSDVDEIKKIKWQIMIIDEAQNIKNLNTNQSKAVRSIPAHTHIAMSGTPVENRLSEFWTIMDYVNHGYMDTSKKFKENFATPIQVSGDMKCVERFRKVTAPFMMRRMKTDKSIISDLPDKVERNEFALLT